MQSKNEWDEKIFIFDFIELCMAYDTYGAGREHKNERDEEEERSISPNPVEVKIVNDGIMFYFMKPLDNVFIQIVDDSGMLVYEESVPLSTSQSYCISMQGLLFKPYLIRVEGDNIYEEFFILF